MKQIVILLLFFSASLVSQETVVVIGGAGYIGSHTAYLLSQNNYNVVIIDSFNHNQLFDPSWAIVYKDDFANTELLNHIFSKYNVTAVMHFAALIEVGESVKNPLTFYENNVGKTITLLKTMLHHNIKRFIFSSTCAVYGIPQWLPLTEEHPKNPINPYGRTKLMMETIIQDLHTSNGLEFVILRYFNAAGAYQKKGLGEQHKPESHVIPLLLKAALEQKAFNVFGTDYETHDGTCIRDYIHVRDIADAHLKALEYIKNGNQSDIFNLGTGKGFSVKEIIECVEKITKKQIAINWSPRRVGDPAWLVAQADKAFSLLKWKPQHSSIEHCVQTAYEFMTSQ